MILITGGAGFIGSRLVHTLNKMGIEAILVVDNMTNGHKFKNLVKAKIFDLMDKGAFKETLVGCFSEPEESEWNEDDLDSNESNSDYGPLNMITSVVHLGACTTTTEWDGRYMLENNYEYSKTLIAFARDLQIPFIYASSAAVYGGNDVFKEEFEHEAPLNVYGYSKWLFDQYVRNTTQEGDPQVVGLRFFNVYGPGEAHKGSMASVVYHFSKQLKESGEIKLFEGCNGFSDGEQRRDFIHVDDVVDIIIHFMTVSQQSGIFNVGTGRSQTFNEVAKAVIAWHKKGKLSYVPFPEHLKGYYQSFTQADISRLRATGYTSELMTVEEGVKATLDEIQAI